MLRLSVVMGVCGQLRAAQWGTILRSDLPRLADGDTTSFLGTSLTHSTMCRMWPHRDKRQSLLWCNANPRNQRISPGRVHIGARPHGHLPGLSQVSRFLCDVPCQAKTTLIGELGVKLVQMKEDLDDTQKGLLADKKFLKELETSCKTKTAEWDERSKTRAEELVALADTIKVLNDDDALDLFKKTLPSAGSSFIQLSMTAADMRKRALAAIRAAHKRGGMHTHRAGLNFLVLALSGRKALTQGGFDKVIKMCDDMVATLKMEQQDIELGVCQVAR